MNSNRHGILFRLKISFRCSVSSLVFFKWIEAKWNSNRCRFHICHFTRMKFWIGMRFSFEQNLPKLIWINADSLDIAFNVHARLKLIVISLRSFWQKWNFILADKISGKGYWKWNASGRFEMQPKKTPYKQSLFSRRFQTRYGFIYTSYVNVVWLLRTGGLGNVPSPTSLSLLKSKIH